MILKFKEEKLFERISPVWRNQMKKPSSQVNFIGFLQAE